MKTHTAFLRFPLACAGFLFCAEPARSEPTLLAPRRDTAPPAEFSTELEAEPVAERYVNGVPVAPPVLEPMEGTPLLGDEESTDQHFGLLARPWIIRTPRLTRYYLEAKARAGTGLPPYLQEVERADRSPTELYDRLKSHDPSLAQGRPPQEKPPEEDNGDNGKPDHVW